MTAGVSPLTILQLSDLHLFAQSNQDLLGVNTRRSLQQVLKAVNALDPQPDVILLTGDLAQDESAEAYQLLSKLFAQIEIPVHFIPGNHDDPELMASILNQPPFCTERVFSVGDWRFILLDSSVRGQVCGSFSDQTLSNLDQVLAASQSPTTIALHHPAYSVQSAWLDIGLENYQDFWAVLDRHPQVQIVLSGHVHQDMVFSRQGVQYLSTPSTCVQFRPHSQSFSVDEREPGFRLLSLFPDGAFQSWVERVPVNQQADLNSNGY